MHDHHSPVFEMLEPEHHHCGCEAPPLHTPCGHAHRIFGEGFTFKPGDFIYWNHAEAIYKIAFEGSCELMVTRVDSFGTWFEAANVGEFNSKVFTLKGAVYIDANGALTNTITRTKVGFIENGHLYLSIERVIVQDIEYCYIVPQTENPPPGDGLLFTKADGFYIQMNGTLYRVNLSAV